MFSAGAGFTGNTGLRNLRPGFPPLCGHLVLGKNPSSLCFDGWLLDRSAAPAGHSHPHLFVSTVFFLSLETCGLGSCPTVTTPPSPRVPTCSSRATWRLFLPAGFLFTCGPRKPPRCPPSFLAGFGRLPPPLRRDGTPTTTRCPFLSLPTSARFSCSVPSLRSCLPTVSFPYWLCVSPPGATRTYCFYGGSVTCLVHSTGAQTSWTTCLFLLDPVRLLPVRARVTVRSPLRAQRSTTVPPP